MVVAVRVGVVKVEPVPKDEPPVRAAYQLYTPPDGELPEAESVTVPEPHVEPPVPVGVVGLTVIENVLLVPAPLAL